MDAACVPSPGVREKGEGLESLPLAPPEGRGGGKKSVPEDVPFLSKRPINEVHVDDATVV